ncbi:hypothetical protein HMPREF1986_00346 [Oribacterium sp. oral taxon 078 str. F0263]|nr:hypothetical protein HMPREF1986_00346 [Oribacterium sp. oral taxon 078 str. F0263]
MRRWHDPLQFGEGAGEGTSGGSGGETVQGTNGEETGVQEAAEGEQEEGAKEEQTDPEGEKKERVTLRDLLSQDKELKKEYDKTVSGIVKNRLKGFDELQKTNQSYQEMARVLMDIIPNAPRDGNPESMLNYLKAQQDLWADAASAAGMSTEAYQKMTNIQRQSEEILGQQRAQQEAALRQQQFENWDRQAEEARELYPDLDLVAELDNPQFTRLMDSGFTVQQAFEAVHHQELMDGAIRSASSIAAQNATRKTVNALRSSQQRPAENGVGGSAGSGAHRLDPRTMSSEQRKSLIDRAMAGERITLND